MYMYARAIARQDPLVTVQKKDSCYIFSKFSQHYTHTKIQHFESDIVYVKTL